MSDYISIQEAIDRLSEALSSEAEFEKAKQVIIEAPTISETEIIRKAFERVLERLEEKAINTRRNAIEMSYTGRQEIVSELDYGMSMAYTNALKIVKEEGGIE